MNRVGNNYNRATDLDQIYQGAYKGAINGGLVGAACVVGGLFQGISFYYLETWSRANGNAPKWNIFPGDCELKEFRDLSFCTDPTPPLYDSATSFANGVVGVSMVFGAIVGGFKAAVKTTFVDNLSA